jgi:hypothetical protein
MKRIISKNYFYFVAILTLLILQGCNGGSNTNSSDSVSIKKDSVVSDSSRAAVLRPKLVSYNASPIESLSAVQSRKNPTPATTVMDLMKENNIPIPVSQVDTVGENIHVSGGTIHVRIYTPKAVMTNHPLVLVPEAKQAQALAAGQLKSAFAK